MNGCVAGATLSYRMEYRMRTKAGGWKWILCQGKNLEYDTQCRPVRMIGTHTDITERKEAEESLEKMRNILSEGQRIAHLGTFEYVTETKTTIWSEEEYRIYGFDPTAPSPGYEVMLAESIHPDDAALVHKTFTAAMQSGSVFELEHRIVRPDGSVRWVYDRAHPYFDWNRTIVRYVGATLDITERKHAEESLNEEREFLRKVIDTAPGMIFLKDWDGRYVLANKALCDYYGTTLEGLIGKTDADFVKNGEEAVRLLQDDREVMRTRHEKRIPEEPVTTLDGQTRWFTSIKVPLINDNGTCDRILGVAVDITERKEIREELFRLNAELEKRVAERTAQLEVINKELEAFSYSVSHDLRAPLRHVREFSKALQVDYGERLDAQGKDYLQRVVAASRRMERLIDDLLELSHLSRREIRKEGVDLSALAQSVAGDLAAKEPARRVEFVIAQGLSAKADPGLLRIVMENLMSNAWKFTRKHPAARIEVGVMRQGDQTVYFVRDDGAGFDMANAAQLFGAFQRLHAAEEFEGSGIGLATVARIINRHGGRIWAEGAVEKGATFYFTLPE